MYVRFNVFLGLGFGAKKQPGRRRFLAILVIDNLPQGPDAASVSMDGIQMYKSLIKKSTIQKDGIDSSPKVPPHIKLKQIAGFTGPIPLIIINLKIKAYASTKREKGQVG